MGMTLADFGAIGGEERRQKLNILAIAGLLILSSYLKGNRELIPLPTS